MAFSVTIKLDLPGADALIQKIGLDEHGEIQRFQTQNVLRRIQKYMPRVSGAFINTTIANTSETEIISVGKQAAYLFYGKVMVNSVTGEGPGVIPGVGPRYKKGTTLKETDRDLEYNKERNPQAGPRWDLALEAHEGDILVSDLQSYINYLARRNK